MDLPSTLPAQLYLLAYDRTKHKVVPRDQIGFVVRAAALVDLVFAGALTEDSRTPVATGTPARDPFEASLLAEIADSRPRSWGHWVGRQSRRSRDQVRDDLVAARWIGIQQHRVLGIFPAERFTLHDGAAHQAFVSRVQTLLRGATPVGRVSRHDAALVALAAGGELKTVFGMVERHRNRKRIDELTAAVGPAAPALRKLIRQLHAQRAAAASAGANSGG